MLLEIRTYKIAPGRLAEFLAAMDLAGPLLAEFGIDVVAAGPSLVPDEGDHAYLMRAFRTAQDRDAAEEAFYSSRAWREGPRAAVLAPIESYHTVVIEAEPAAIDALRR